MSPSPSTLSALAALSGPCIAVLLALASGTAATAEAQTPRAGVREQKPAAPESERPARSATRATEPAPAGTEPLTASERTVVLESGETVQVRALPVTLGTSGDQAWLDPRQLCPWGPGYYEVGVTITNELGSHWVSTIYEFTQLRYDFCCPEVMLFTDGFETGDTRHWN